MALITDYASLQAHVTDTLNRTDLDTVVVNFIQQFEQQAKRDIRLTQHVEQSTFLASADGDAMPSDMYRLDAWYHDGATYFGPIGIVGADEVGHLKASYGATGVPQFAALVGDGSGGWTARYAPVPDASHTTKITYLRRILSLSDTNTTNYLLTQAPDIYLYGVLAESAPYLKDDNRVGLWKTLLEERIEAFRIAQQDAQFGGSIQRVYTPIGG